MGHDFVQAVVLLGIASLVAIAYLFRVLLRGKVHFDRVDSADLYRILLGCPSPICHEPPATPHISGIGTLDPQDVELPLISELTLSVTYNQSISSTCIEEAKSAFAHHNQLDIIGEATILPLPFGSGSSSSTSAQMGTSRKAA